MKIPVPSVLAGLSTSVAVAALTSVAAAARALGLRGVSEDLVSAEDLQLHADRETVVMSRDRVPLHVREIGPRDAPITVVFIHGFTLRSASWVLVSRALQTRWGTDVRMVLPDCRGHGDSGGCPPESATVAMLGDDIAIILDAVANTGPVVLVGHSMGGMAICGFATLHPERIGTQVVATALLGTASHVLTDVGLAAALRNPVIDVFKVAVRFLPAVVSRGRDLVTPLAIPFVTAGAYGPGEHSATVAQFSGAMSLSAPLASTAAFLAALEEYDERDALPILRAIEASVICGDHDWMTPLRKSKQLAQQLDCELIVLEHTGHMLILESPEPVARALAALVTRVTGVKS